MENHSLCLSQSLSLFKNIQANSAYLVLIQQISENVNNAVYNVHVKSVNANMSSNYKQHSKTLSVQSNKDRLFVIGQVE